MCSLPNRALVTPVLELLASRCCSANTSRGWKARFSLLFRTWAFASLLWQAWHTAYLTPISRTIQPRLMEIAWEPQSQERVYGSCSTDAMHKVMGFQQKAKRPWVLNAPCQTQALFPILFSCGNEIMGLARVPLRGKGVTKNELGLFPTAHHNLLKAG